MSDDSSTAGGLQAAHDEWDWFVAEGAYGEFDTSIPCQFRFTDEPAQNTRRFHVELYRRGYGNLDTDPERSLSGTERRPYYNGEICSREHYHRITVRVFPDRTVRLYPNDDYVPTVDELGEVVAAIEAGFGASLEHHPIERDNDD